MTATPVPSDPAPLPPAPAPSAGPPAVRPPSPRWGVMTKFLIAMVLVVLLGALLVRFQQMLAPLALSVILAYLLKPVVETISARTRLSWRASAALIYLLVLIVIITLLTVAGIALAQQLQSLSATVVEIAADPAGRIEAILSEPFVLGPYIVDLSRPFTIGPFGPFQLDVRSADWAPLLQQVFNAIQPVLSRTGTLVSNLATGTASTLGWILFILVISYYLLNDLGNIGLSIERLVPAEYQYDVRRLLSQLGPIWNAFLRGQITLGIVMGLVVGVAMAILGVRYAVVLGLLAGLLEFVPIIGPFIAGAVAVVVALFQPTNWLGLNPLTFALVVLAVFALLQQIENNFLVPRILGGSLNLHPIVILVGALIAANLAGIIGLLLSAPTMATLRLIGQYVFRKLFDLDPWPDPPTIARPPVEVRWWRWLRLRAAAVWAARRRKT
jgi:predicted PurR-regulated permease PerM